MGRTAQILRVIVGMVSAIVCAMCLVGLITSFASPGFLEAAAQGFVKQEVRQRVAATVSHTAIASSDARVGRIGEGRAVGEQQARQMLMRQLDDRMTKLLPQLRDVDCPCRRDTHTSPDWESKDGRTGATSGARERLTELIRMQYVRTAEKLLREFRIFTGINAVVAGLILIAVLVKRRANLHLLPSAGVLILAAMATAWLYLFEQDWLRSIVFNDFVGWGYLCYLVVASALLGDVMLNRARVTASCLNFAFQAGGSEVSVLPC